MNLDALPDDATVTVKVGWLRSVLEASPVVEEGADRLAPLTVAEVAEVMDRSTSTVRGWLASGELEGFRVGREWRVRPEAIEDYYAKAEATHREDSEPDAEDADLGAWRRAG